MRITRLSSLLVAACGAAPPHAGASDPAALVACWRDAVGGQARLSAVRAIEREAKTEADGLTGVLRTVARADGAYREDETLGPSSDVIVFDGAHGWVRGGFGPVGPLARTELEHLATKAYLASFGPLVDGKRPGRVQRGPHDHTLIVRAEHGRDMLVTLDPATCLPRAFEKQDDEVTVTYRPVGWTEVGGIKLPTELAIETSHGDKVRIIYGATNLDEPLAADLFVPPGLDPRAQIPKLTAPLVIPAELTQNHVYVQAKINGRGPIAVLVDTGAGGLLIDGDRARELGLAGTGTIPIRGAGAGKLDSQVVALPRVELAGTEIPMEAANLTPLRALSHHEGRAMQGIIGYEAIGHYVAEFDYATPAVRLHDPGTWQPPPDAVALPFYLFDTKPIIEVTFELADGRRFTVQTLVDTGNRGAFSIATAFVKKHHLVEHAGPVLSAPLGFGVGGQTKQALGRITALHLGSLTLRDVLGSFSEDTEGADASDQAVQANLGSGLMKQLTVWFDYPDQKMYVQKNAHFGEPFEYDASGILLDSPDDTFQRAVVKSVLPSSPASTAGIQPGDELLSLDDEPVAKLGLEAVRARLRIADRHVRLGLSRGGTPRTAKLVTKKLI